jgi:uncharacterized membrane protein YhhN
MGRVHANPVSPSLLTQISWLLLTAAAVFAVTDWVAVLRGLDRLEYIAKPATMVALIGVALTLHPHIDTRRWAFVVALVFSLAGDVFLMLPRDYFVQGLGSFLLAHIAYIAGLRVGATEIRPLVLSAIPVAVASTLIGARVLRALREKRPELVVPVSAYIGVIAVMVAAALATGEPLAAFGAVFFMASDSLIAWSRFVMPLEWAPVTIIVTYHIAQAMLVLSLGL